MPILFHIIFHPLLASEAATSAEDPAAQPSSRYACVAAAAASSATEGIDAFTRPAPIRTPIVSSSTTPGAARPLYRGVFELPRYERVKTMAEFIESLRRDIPEFHQMYDDGLPTTPRALRDHFRRLETMFDIAVMTLTSYEVGAQLFALDLAYIRRQESMGIRRSVYRLSERYADEEDSIVRFLEDRKDALMFLRSQIVMKLPRLVIEHDGKRLGFVLHGKRDNFVGFKELTPEEPAKTVVSVKENSSCCIVM